MKIACTLICPLLIFCLFSCEKDYALLNEYFQQSEQSTHFIYYQNPGDTAKMQTEWQERYFDWLMGQLNIYPDFKIIFYKYESVAMLEEVTGRQGNAFAEYDKLRIHSIWPKDNHECVHILVNNYMGIPPALFDEGIAVAHQADYFQGQFVPGWNGNDFDSLVASFIDQQRMLSLNDVLESKSFRSFDSHLTYPISGSFFCYLKKNYSWQRIIDFFEQSSYNNSCRKSCRLFEKCFETALQDVWNDWLQSLP
jgi:hypothetical protein